MTRSRVLAAVAFAAALAAAPRAWSRPPPVLVTPASGSGVSADFVQRARRAFIDALDAQHQLFLIDMERPPRAEPAPDEEVLTTARSFGAEVILMVHLAREGVTTALWVRALDAATGEQLFLDQENTDGGPERLTDMATALAAHAELRLRPVMSRVRQRNPRRGFLMGELSLLVLTEPRSQGPEDPGAMPVFGLGYMHATKTMLAEVSGRFGAAASTEGQARLLADLGFGVYGFLPGSLAWRPYLGSGVRWGHLDFRGVGETGVSLVPTLGVLYVGESAALRLGLGYLWSFTEEHGLDRLVPNATDGKHNQGVMLLAQVGL